MSAPNILITGATGFVGGAAAAHLLQNVPEVRLQLLVRAETQEHAEERARKSLRRFLEPGKDDLPFERCAIIRGDLTGPAGLEDSRLNEATHVLHAAANTSLRSTRSVRETNIDGTRRLADRLEKSPRLTRFLYAGTAYICGAHPPAVVREDDYPRPDSEHVAEYTRSKAEAEKLLESRALPLVIARPSVVVGHTRLGCLPSASIFWYYRAVDLLRRTTASPDARKDIIPVDYAAEALAHLLLKPELKHRRYHVSAGEVSCVSWREMAAAFSLARGGGAAAPYAQVSFEAIREEWDRLRELLGSSDDRRLLLSLESFYKFSASGVEVFDNRRLLEEGMPAPPKFTSYLPVCLARPPNRSVYEQMCDDE